MEPLKKDYEDLLLDVKTDIAKLGIVEKEQEVEVLKHELALPGVWDNNKEAQEKSKRLAQLENDIRGWVFLRESAKNYLGMTNDESLKEDLAAELKKLKEQHADLKKQLRFQGTYDDHDVILNIYAGAGGTDAQDWAQMLERMYLRWAEKQRLKAKVVDESPGDEAGIKSATIELAGHSTGSGQGNSYLYGKLAGEQGVHRLVRRSPFNSAASRETSFAKVDVLPLISQPSEVEIDDKDLKVDVYRAGGHGGQSVNTTDSAVRVTHLPTGVTVAIQNERSQLQNKETALAILRSRLAQLQQEQHAETLADIKGPSQSNEFGSQIRNYILDDRILKDLRSGYENHDPQKTLDGDLDPLIEAWLQAKH